MWDCFGNKEHIEEILALKHDMGQELIILTHHYQRPDIVKLGDYCGDSFELSRRAAMSKSARFIVFCGVHFMAESAAILSKDSQIVQIPNPEAGCWMADMADLESVEEAWDELLTLTGESSIVPLVYMNSDASLKAFCGYHGGAVCTSSNAFSIFEWGLKNYEKILFLPDRHLGFNVGKELGISPSKMVVWNPDEPLGGNTREQIKRAKLILWNGYCLVHTRFTTEHVLDMKERFPDAKLVVHPECTHEVVSMADTAGSTNFIVNFVNNAPSSSTIVIGTEINLVNRLSLEYPDKNILDLYYSLCPNMFKINLDNLLWTLKNIGEVNVVTVPDETKVGARKALERMLSLAR